MILNLKSQAFNFGFSPVNVITKTIDIILYIYL